MNVNKSLFKKTLVGFFVVILIVLILGAISSQQGTLIEAPGNTQVVSNSDGVQFIDLTAKGGYFPASIVAKGGMKTILRVKTNNTFDCSTYIRIHSLSLSRSLPVNGTTDIELGNPEVGTEIQGTCGMGMYNFKIKFS